MAGSRLNDPTRLAAVFLLSSFLLACSQSGQVHVASSSSQAGSLPPPDPPGTYRTETDYRIGPLDQLEISVFQVPDLNRTVQVDASGQITLPLIGGVASAGKTVEELETEIARQLGVKYLKNPQVSVAVKQSPGQRVTVEGAVSSPGMYPLIGKTTLLQTIALSGGLADVAKASNVAIFRMVQNQRVSATFNIKTIRSGKAPDPEVYGGDVVVVGESGTKTALRDFGRVMPLAGLVPLIP